MPNLLQELNGLSTLQKRILRMLSCGAKTMRAIQGGMRFESLSRTSAEMNTLETKGVIEHSLIAPGEYAPGGSTSNALYHIPDNDEIWKWVFINI